MSFTVIRHFDFPLNFQLLNFRLPRLCPASPPFLPFAVRTLFHLYFLLTLSRLCSTLNVSIYPLLILPSPWPLHFFPQRDRLTVIGRQSGRFQGLSFLRKQRKGSSSSTETTSTVTTSVKSNSTSPSPPPTDREDSEDKSDTLKQKKTKKMPFRQRMARHFGDSVCALPFPG